jgi:chromosomal replication initiation ATPase DnaA
MELARAVASTTSVKLDEMQSNHRTEDVLWARRLFVCCARFGLKATFASINKFMNKGTSWAENTATEAEKLLTRDPSFTIAIRRVAQQFTK